VCAPAQDRFCLYSIFKSLCITSHCPPGEYGHPSSKNMDASDGPQKLNGDFLKNGSNNSIKLSRLPPYLKLQAVSVHALGAKMVTHCVHVVACMISDKWWPSEQQSVQSCEKVCAMWGIVMFAMGVDRKCVLESSSPSIWQCWHTSHVGNVFIFDCGAFTSQLQLMILADCATVASPSWSPYLNVGGESFFCAVHFDTRLSVQVASKWVTVSTLFVSPAAVVTSDFCNNIYWPHVAPL
jgi:hypothetical protein